MKNNRNHNPGAYFYLQKKAMKIYMTLVVALVLAVSAVAQEAEGIEAVMRFMGVDSPENLDPAEVERLEDFLERPLRINMVSQSRLQASGLLSPYQIASLSDYRVKHANVMSYTELATVDGFGPDAVQKLRPFISLECNQLHNDVMNARHDLAVKSAYKATGMPIASDWSYGLKYRFRTDRLTASIGTTKPYSSGSPWPQAYTGSLSYDFRKTRIIIGDFNARFGQGLALWSGAFMTSLSSPDAFMKKPSGISGTYSFTGSSALTGVAAETNAGRFRITALMAVPGVKEMKKRPEKVSLLPVANLTYLTRFGHASMTYAGSKASVDGAFCIKGVNVFSEAVYDFAERRPEVVSGTEFNASEKVRLASLARYCPKDSYQAAFSGAFKTSRPDSEGTFSVDAVCYPLGKGKEESHSVQVKVLANWECALSPSLRMKIRLSERFRTWGSRFRTDMRADLSYAKGSWIMNMRLNALRCVRTGFVSYFEEGYKTSDMSVYLRQGLFFVDDWEDRIYVYERDAPGSFNVPAMYGRGWFASVVGSAHVSRSIRLYVRASYTGYQFMPHEKRKPGKAELKLQMIAKF